MFSAFIGCFSKWHTEVEICDYLELAGHKVDRYHFSNLDLEKFKNRAGRYDVVITSLPQVFPPDFWREVSKSGPTLIAWYFDWIKNYHGRQQAYINSLQDFDLILSTDGFSNDVYKGLPRHWLPHACDPRVYFPVSSTIQSDCQFCGHVYTPHRKRLLKGLRENFAFTWVGGNEECWGPAYSVACNSTKIVIGDNHRNDVPGYWSDRLYLAESCGAFLLYPDVPGIETQFTDGKHLVLYKSEADLHDKIRYYLNHDDERRKIAQAGCEHAHKYHSWKVRIEEFEQILSRTIL